MCYIILLFQSLKKVQVAILTFSDDYVDSNKGFFILTWVLLVELTPYTTSSR